MARKAFLWVLGARKPLSVLELQHGCRRRIWSKLMVRPRWEYGLQFQGPIWTDVWVFAEVLTGWQS